jgi:protein-S-isoprenylcysteine O-methyltransferase Ste14
MSTLINRFALGAVIAAVVILAVTGNLFSASPLVITAQVLGLGLTVWARRSFPKGSFRVTSTPGADAVVQRGPYRLVRHPMYAGVLLFVWAGVIAHRTLLAVIVGAVATVVVAARIVSEERLLRERYPGYAEYARSTKAVIPYVL